MARLVSHIKRVHLSSDERKAAMREVLSSDHSLYTAVSKTLKAVGQWLCGPCMAIHALSRSCHHQDGLTRFSGKDGDRTTHLVGIVEPLPVQVSECETVSGATEVVFDANLLSRILQIPIFTVKSIPLGCRMSFSRLLKSALLAVVDQPGSVGAWVKLLLLPRCTLRVVRPSRRRDIRSGGRKALQKRAILQSLAAWDSEEGVRLLIQALLDEDRSKPVRPGGCGDLNGPTESPTTSNVRQCLRKVGDGHFTAAVKVLSSSGVAPYGRATMEALRAKRPIMPPPSMPSSGLSEPPLIVSADIVSGCLKSFPKGTSCGRDGLRAQHLLDALCGEGSFIATDLLQAITSVVNLWLSGRCPLVLAEFIASAPLNPLLKPDGGIRPIAVGCIWRRLVSKVAMRGVRKEVADYLVNFQFGVGVSGGAEAILHSVNRLLLDRHSDGSLALLTVDFSNAFNMVDRSVLLREVRARCPSISLWVEFLYGQSARLYVGDDYIWSSTGVQQGDPLGPLLFALVLHPLAHAIRDHCSLLLHAWYLDDGTIIGDAGEVARALDILRVNGPDMGLHLNLSKTEVFWPSCDGQKQRVDLFPAALRRPPTGVKLLGGAVSRDGHFIQDLAMKRAIKAVDLMRLLSQLRDPQSELLLLRSCMGIAKMFFGLRTCPPAHIEEASLLFDQGLREAVEGLVVCGGPFFGDLQWRLATLPLKLGGLGLYSAIEASTYAFVASRAQSWVLQDHILRDSGLRGLDPDFSEALDNLRIKVPSIELLNLSNKDTVPPKIQHTLANALFRQIVEKMEGDFSMTQRQKAVFKCLQAPHAQDFLLAMPIDGLGQHMSPVEYRSILKYRLLIPLFPSDEVCPVCRKACLDSFGEHALHCRELPGFKYRHDLVRDILADICRRAGISVKKEAPVNFLTDPLEGRSSLRPADVLIFGWIGGKHACVDLTGVSPLAGFTGGEFTVGQAALKAAAGKVAKHEKACLDNQHVFLPFAFDIFGFLAPDAIQLLHRIQHVMDGNVSSSKSESVVFRRIGFAIQKGVAAQLVARLPSIMM